MHLFQSFVAVITFFYTSTLVSSLHIFPSLGNRNVHANNNEMLRRVDMTNITDSNPGCVGPSQMNSTALDASDPSLGSCNWKKWVECTALAVGACLPACVDGGFLDPACDICIEGLGTLDCKKCVESPAAQQLWSYQQKMLSASFSALIAQRRPQYCPVPKRAASLIANTNTTASNLQDA